MSMRVCFLFVLAAAGGFVWLSSNDLPAIMASHFGPGGNANGFVRRDAYAVPMLALVVLVPLLVASGALLVSVLPLRFINLPNKQYWLAPERRGETLEALESLSLRFAVVLTVFLCFVHWLVVRANSVQPPALPENWFFAGLAVFGAVTLAWVVNLFRRFGRIPDRFPRG